MGVSFLTSCGWGSLPRQCEPAMTLSAFSELVAFLQGASWVEVLFLSLEEHETEPLGHSGSQTPMFVSSVQQHEAWLYRCTTVDCWLLKWKRQQRRWEGKTGQLKGHHHITLHFKGLIKIQCVLQLCRHSVCEFTLHRHRSTSGAQMLL